MIGILIRYKGRSLFTELPKELHQLQNEVSSIGVNVYLDILNLSNQNSYGYTINIYAQDSVDMEVAERIRHTDNLRQLKLNDLIGYIAQNDNLDMYEKISNSNAESIAELFDELTAPPIIETVQETELKTVKAPITDSEKRLLDTISSIADRIATFAHLGYRDFALEDTMKDLDCDFDDIKDMILHAAAEKVRAKPDIASVEVSELGIPLQPEITVSTIEETEDMTVENEELSGISF